MPTAVSCIACCRRNGASFAILRPVDGGRKILLVFGVPKRRMQSVGYARNVELVPANKPRPGAADARPDSLHVSIPAQTGSRVFAFSLRSHRELKKIDPKTNVSMFLMPTLRADEAVVSPEGQSLLYVDRPAGSLWLSRMDTKKQLRLTDAPLVAAAPRWSRDGKRILFTGVQPGHARQIYMLSSDGGGLRAVLPEGREGASADWSPDDTQIVVSMRDVKSRQSLEFIYSSPKPVNLLCCRIPADSRNRDGLLTGVISRPWMKANITWCFTIFKPEMEFLGGRRADRHSVLVR